MAPKEKGSSTSTVWTLLGISTLLVVAGLLQQREWTHRPLEAIISALVVLYLHQYFSNYGKLPVIFCKKGTRLETILSDRISSLKRPYRPPLWCAESRLQTIVSCIRPSFSKVNWINEEVESHQGGRFCVKWYCNQDSAKFPDPCTRPTVLLVLGVTSTIDSSYVKSMTNCLALGGYRIMVLIYRSLEGMELLTPVTYCATYTKDLRQCVEMIQERYPKSNAFAIGISLGSLVLGRYLSENGEDTFLKAGILISCPFNPPDCARNMDSFWNRTLLSKHVATTMKKFYRRNSQVFEKIVDHQKVESSTYIRDFDNHFTSRVFGYRNADEYYADAALSVNRMQNIKRPLLCVGANDDPFSPECALPKKDFQQTENVAMIMTYGGGHVSHLQMLFPFSKTYYEDIVEEYLDVLVNNKDSPLEK